MKFLDSICVTYLHDHGEGGQKLRLFKEGTEGWHYSEVDIIILDNDKRVADMIEIMDGPITPKSIGGIVGTTALCHVCVDAKGNVYRFYSPRLFVVLNSKELDREGSVKRMQMDAIQNALSDEQTSLVRLGQFKSIRVCTDAEFEKSFGSEGREALSKKKASRVSSNDDIGYA
jgi:hypothetical protein